MSALVNIERCNQDAANLTTVSGLSGLSVVGLFANQLPGPKIDRGYANLRHVANKLHERVIPLEDETWFFKHHKKYVLLQVVPKSPTDAIHFCTDRLFETGRSLKEQEEALSRWKIWKLYKQASEFESDTSRLRTKVQVSPVPSSYTVTELRCTDVVDVVGPIPRYTRPQIPPVYVSVSASPTSSSLRVRLASRIFR